MAGMARAKSKLETQKRRADAAFSEAIVWGYYLERYVAAYGAIPDRTQEDAAALREMRLRARQNIRVTCRRIERAFEDKERVARGISLESILGDWLELAA